MGDIELLDSLIGDMKDRIYDYKDTMKSTDSKLEKYELKIRVNELNRWVESLQELRRERL